MADWFSENVGSEEGGLLTPNNSSINGTIMANEKREKNTKHILKNMCLKKKQEIISKHYLIIF